ncbi:MAG: hypothetical protein OEX08_01555 [Candidatus Nomurabacteria bacterium]|nr:hypothetical protein [Candidatus Nomurabacteria bacterium]
MIDLNKNENKKKIRAEYFLRAVTLVLRGGATVFFVGIILLAPVYVTTRLKGKEQVDRVREIYQNSSFQETLALNESLRETNTRLKLFEKDRSDAVSKNIFEPLFSIFGSFDTSIDISEILFEENQESDRGKKTEKGQINVTIKGRADTRENLIAFSDELKTLPFFSDFRIPVSLLAKTHDIDFTFSTKTPGISIFE